MQMLIKAEWLDNWYLHLKVVKRNSSLYNLYAKYARIYLQSILEHPDVHQHFKDGFHVGRRSNQSWAGLSTDLMIEQVLRRTHKTSDGLMRGRRMM